MHFDSVLIVSLSFCRATKQLFADVFSQPRATHFSFALINCPGDVCFLPKKNIFIVSVTWAERTDKKFPYLSV